MSGAQRSHYQTIIVGGGVSGLACAHQLAKHGHDFFLLSSKIGGRVTTSDDGRVNYGAYFFGKNYKHVRPFVDIKRRFSVNDVVIHGPSPYMATRALRYPWQASRFAVEVFRFRAAYSRYQQKALSIGQKQALESSPYLINLYNRSAAETFSDWGIGSLAEEMIEPISRMCTLLPLTKVSAFHVLHLLAHSFAPVYDFTLRPGRLTAGFTDRISLATVTKISRAKTYDIETDDGNIYRAESVVLATPAEISERLLGEHFPRHQRYVTITHVRGTIRAPWKKKTIHVFQAPTEVAVIIKQIDESYLLASESPSIDLDKYFHDHDIIAIKYWRPAFHFGSTLIEARRDHNLYMIGDYNIVGLEDSFQTGLYAANQILH